jgi:hypothetical protein
MGDTSLALLNLLAIVSNRHIWLPSVSFSSSLG